MNDKAPPHSHSKASAHSADAHDSISVEAFRPLRPMPAMIFASRWLQVPLYLGLIVAQAVYVVLFIQELMHLVPILWDPNALAATASTLGVEKVSKEIVVMLVVLSLIDLEGHPDQPEWLSHVNANILKVKLATAIIGISSIHLLKTFISADAMSDKALLWQTIIHVTFILSAISIAYIDRLLNTGANTHSSAVK